MEYPKLYQGILEKRYKRFLADVTLDSGEKLTAYCPNTGSMLGCAIPGSKVWLSKQEDTKRKYPYTLEIVAVEEELIGINTALPNKLVEEAIRLDKVPSFRGFTNLKKEVKYGKENSRIDILLEYPDNVCYVEVKNVTLVENNIAYFPDAVTTRGQKHLRELTDVVKQGNRGAIVFCVQHTAAKEVRPASHLDATYAKLLKDAYNAGVEVIAIQADITTSSTKLNKILPVNL